MKCAKRVDIKNNKLFCYVMILIEENFIKDKLLIEIRGNTLWEGI